MASTLAEEVTKRQAMTKSDRDNIAQCSNDPCSTLEGQNCTCELLRIANQTTTIAIGMSYTA